jgi:hypothetical protein
MPTIKSGPTEVTFMMSISGGGELGPHFATLKLTKVTVEELLRRAGYYRVHKRMDPRLYHHTYFDPLIEVFQADEEHGVTSEDAEKIKEIFEYERYPTDGLQEVMPRDVPESGNVRLECDELIVTGSMAGERPDMVDYRWEALIKHTDITVSTCDLTEEVVRALLARLS